jgi:hypothetical protein
MVRGESNLLVRDQGVDLSRAARTCVADWLIF